MDKVYLGMRVRKTIDVSVMGNIIELPFKDCAEGCIGMMMVFDTIENAKAFLPDDAEIQEMTVWETEEADINI